MAAGVDNTILNPGSGGDIIATDDIGGIKHELVKVEFGGPDSATQVENKTGKRLPVNLGDGTVEDSLRHILVELRVITEFLKQGLNIRDDADVYREDPYNYNN